MNFWSQLKKDLGGKPILCLAPMADVTDRAFRQIIAKYSKKVSINTPSSKLGVNTLTSVPFAGWLSREEEKASRLLSVLNEEDVFTTSDKDKSSLERLSCGNSYVTWTEFVSADGLFKGGYDALINDLKFTEIERPIVAQFFTSSPEMMEKAAALALELGFDGVDINMGCPDKSVEKGGAGAALIKNPELAKEIILAAKRGAKSDDGGIPVSVKTRIGYNKDELETWLPHLLSVSPAVITIHARTRKEMSLVPARWERVKRAVEIRNELQGDDNFPLNNFSTHLSFSSQHPQNSTDIFLLKNSSCSAQSASQGNSEGVAPKNSNQSVSQASFQAAAPENSSPILQGNSEGVAKENLNQAPYKTLIFGNGDVLDVEDAYKKAEESGADGVMIGRGIFGNPWLFANLASVKQSSQIERPAEALAKEDISVEMKLRVFLEQAKLFEKIVGPKWPEGQGKSFAVMKKHLKAYCEGFPGSKELRTKMMEAENTVEMERLVNEFLMSYN